VLLQYGGALQLVEVECVLGGTGDGRGYVLPLASTRRS
jgi:hypothetical protein